MTPERIRSAEWRPLVLRLRRPLATANGPMQERRGALVRLRASDGRTGWGEGLPLATFGTEELPRFEAALERLLPALVSAALPESLEQVEALLARLGDFQGLPATRAALELALLDLAAGASGQSLAALLAGGGTVRPTVEVNALLGSVAPVDVREESAGWAGRGFRHFKLKVGIDSSVEAEQARVEAVRAGAPQLQHLRADANGVWDREQALERLRGLAERGVALCEQPLSPEDVEGLRALRGRSGLLIAADESLTQREQARRLLEGAHPAADVFVLKPLVLGGLLPSLQLARDAASRGVSSYVTSTLDGPVARAAALHLASVLPPDFAHGLAVGALFENPDAPELEPLGGSLRVPSGPGLGVGPGSWAEGGFGP